MVQHCLEILFPESDLFLNGIYSPYTEHLIAKFQEQTGLKPSGIVNENTWQALRSTISSFQELYLRSTTSELT